MPLLKINASPAGLRFHNDDHASLLRPNAQCHAPIIIMIHGYKHDPSNPEKCPHKRIFCDQSAYGWPNLLGYSRDEDTQALCIGFGWPARGGLRNAHRRAGQMASHLADFITMLRVRMPNRPIHILAHSLGSEMALSALPFLRFKDVGRIILISGATYKSHARAMLATPAGKSAEILNVVSRENDIFDHMFEQLIPSTQDQDRTLGEGLCDKNVVNLQLDCERNLAAIALLGTRIAPPKYIISHRSGYRRQGAMAFYAQILGSRGHHRIANLKTLLPAKPGPRWGRMAQISPIRAVTRLAITARLRFALVTPHKTRNIS